MTRSTTSVPIGRTGRVAIVHGWSLRREAHPNLARVALEAADSLAHEYLYRGDQNLANPEQLFLVGEKAWPLRHGGDTARLDRASAELLGQDEAKFRELAEAYRHTGMARRRSVATPSLDEIVDLWCHASTPARYAIALVLLAALQYQNSRREVMTWREYLWFLSCTRSDSVALTYALGSRGGLPATTYVIEYAPPTDLVMSVEQFAEWIDRLRLGSAFPDLDDEVFALNALLPHYILGYTRLHRLPDAGNIYGTEFVPSPHYNGPGASIRRPPDLNEAQRDVFEETRQALAWVEARDGRWTRVYDPRGPRTLGLDPEHG